ncbi:serine/threonine-protein kinase/endoribonuclease IRE1b isoform X1 [Brassica rapa]|uniref:serine/threonine-protein kinase/endoribonuclease IRE1b isoform X1 n=1 Tax=Brassica campestris TaxID=3711 RepID=UPI0008728AD7|nr:serine/threonine-protein kinase/endoribonuclease IRE1b isoform X1 [Brassica rapa]
MSLLLSLYLSLERCACSLNNLIHASSGFLESSTASVVDNGKGVELWKENGHPSPVWLKLMRDIVAGLVHLHDIGIIHRDLKPQNVLIVKNNSSLCAKLSDMGIRKCLPAETSALTRNSTGSGSSGWQAPEQLRNERQTRAVDLFGLSDRVELENREEGSQLLAALESTVAVTLNGRWDEKLDGIFLDNIGRYR